MRVLAAMSVLAASLALGTAADASCAPPAPLPERIGRADAIVWGTVTGFEGGLVPDPRMLIVRVQTAYKGSVPAQIVVTAGPEVPGAAPGQRVATSVDYRAAAGTSHTFYLMRTASGGFRTDACGGSHEGEPTPEELAALGSAGPPDRAPRASATPDPMPEAPGSVTDLDRGLVVGAIIAVLAATYLAFRSRPA